jgi:hypothetical protein
MQSTAVTGVADTPARALHMRPPAAHSMEVHMTFAALGGLIIVLGVAGWMYADIRAFHRTNAAGVEVFSGWFSMLFSRLFEGALRLFGKLSFLLGIVAVARARTSKSA